MNKNRKVYIVILVTTLLYVILSFYSDEFITLYPNFKNVNILAEITKKPRSLHPSKKSTVLKKQILSPEGLPFNDFDSYQKKGTIIAFNSDTIEPALTKFDQKLFDLTQNKKVKIRIAWFGDSQIEGDFITQDLRILLQNYFGQKNGVGFVPMASIASDFRSSAKLITTGDLVSTNLKSKTLNPNLFLSGYSFFSNDLILDFKDNVKRNANQITQKWLLYGKGDSIAIKIKDSIKKFPATSDFNRVLIGSSNSNKINCHIFSKLTPIYGISSEPESGITIDNFSFRGITGVELKRLNDSLLKALNQSEYYDLIVVQYGVNLMFKPNDTNYDYYYRAMKPVLKKLKKGLSNSEFLIFSCSDRAFNYDGQWKTAVGIDSLIQIQAQLAFENEIPFYNLYQTMGGNGTIVKWADSLHYANKDYIHFNFKGSKVVANMIYKAILNDYNKLLKKQNSHATKKEVDL